MVLSLIIIFIHILLKKNLKLSHSYWISPAISEFQFFPFSMKIIFLILFVVFGEYAVLGRWGRWVSTASGCRQWDYPCSFQHATNAGLLREVHKEEWRWWCRLLCELWDANIHRHAAAMFFLDLWRVKVWWTCPNVLAERACGCPVWRGTFFNVLLVHYILSLAPWQHVDGR